MLFYSRRLSKFLKRIPGEKTFGIYRFLPCFFLLGAALEFSMINWTVGETNFCKSLQFRRSASRFSVVMPHQNSVSLQIVHSNDVRLRRSLNTIYTTLLSQFQRIKNISDTVVNLRCLQELVGVNTSNSRWLLS